MTDSLVARGSQPPEEVLKRLEAHCAHMEAVTDMIVLSLQSEEYDRTNILLATRQKGLEGTQELFNSCRQLVRGHRELEQRFSSAISGLVASSKNIRRSIVESKSDILVRLQQLEKVRAGQLYK
jgi:hypothetical protein